MIDEDKLIKELKFQINNCETYGHSDIYIDLEMAKKWVETIEKKKVGEWIPVEERLPKNYENVLVSCQNGEVDYGFHDKDSGWVLDYVDDKAYPVLAWQPLPEPYEVKENE